MKIGTRSLLFGVHQFVIHPIVVLIAWIKLYGMPSWKEFICIVIHDWGYWGAPNMDGIEGELHPELAANIAKKWLGEEYHELCLYHSRHYARYAGKEPSKLCWADKLSIKYEPWWFYIPRALVTGELKEYREKAKQSGYILPSATNREWYRWAQKYMIEQGLNQKSTSKLVNANKYTHKA
jgi:hypothetical protein